MKRADCCGSNDPKVYQNHKDGRGISLNVQRRHRSGKGNLSELQVKDRYKKSMNYFLEDTSPLSGTFACCTSGRVSNSWGVSVLKSHSQIILSRPCSWGCETRIWILNICHAIEPFFCLTSQKPIPLGPSLWKMVFLVMKVHYVFGLTWNEWL